MFTKKLKNIIPQYMIPAIVPILIIVLLLSIFGALNGCSAAEQKSREISRQADNFETPRCLKIINTRNDKIVLEFIGTFSVQSDKDNHNIDILCAIGDGIYEKHFFSLNEWTIYVVEDVSNQGIEKYYHSIRYYPENK